MQDVLRLEKKYLMTREETSKLDHVLCGIMHQDRHNGSKGYLVRSLYFDTIQERDFYEKEDGLELRRKIRLRVYSPGDEFASLEMKQKQGENQRKRSLRVTREDAEALIRGQYSVLLKYHGDFAKECYGMLNLYCYRPKSIVEYRRKAFVADENKIRLTLDSEIVATESDFRIFAPNLNMYPVMDHYEVVLEVKYNGFLLTYIKDAVSRFGKIPTSVSKYCLSRQVGLHYLMG